MRAGLPGATPRAPYGDDQAAILNADGLAQAWAVISSWPGYAQTPLINLTGLAREANVSFFKTRLFPTGTRYPALRGKGAPISPHSHQP